MLLPPFAGRMGAKWGAMRSNAALAQVEEQMKGRRKLIVAALAVLVVAGRDGLFAGLVADPATQESLAPARAHGGHRDGPVLQGFRPHRIHLLPGRRLGQKRPEDGRPGGQGPEGRSGPGPGQHGRRPRPISPSWKPATGPRRSKRPRPRWARPRRTWTIRRWNMSATKTSCSARWWRPRPGTSSRPTTSWPRKPPERPAGIEPAQGRLPGGGHRQGPGGL